MIKIFKSNKFISILLIIMCIIIVINPSFYAKSCLNGISVWAFKVLPLMFPFFVLTKLISNFNTPKQNFMDKFFNKLYNVPNGSFSTFLLATLSGYPMGAKLICSMHENNQISSLEAEKMLSFCSVSGPMFMVGTVGVAMFNNFKSGLIILISNIIASLINGLVYRGKPQGKNKNIVFKTKSKASLSDCVYDSLISILMVGSYIVISFIVIDMLNSLHITDFIANSICGVFKCSKHRNVVQSLINGTFEITRGIFDLSKTSISLKFKTIISSCLIGFGGISIMLQSFSFIEKINMPFKKMLAQKTTQAVFCLFVSIVLSLLFLN